MAAMANIAAVADLNGFRIAPVFAGGTGRALDVDTQLVERCLGGEDAAWEDLVKVHTRRVYAICYRFTGSDSEAQDLAQEVFLRVFRSLKSFRSGEGSFQVWLDPADPESVDRSLPPDQVGPVVGFD